MFRVLEGLLVCLVTTVVIFMASMTLGECRDLVSPAANNTTALVSVRLHSNHFLLCFLLKLGDVMINCHSTFSLEMSWIL